MPPRPGASGVTLATLHKAKGLEWDIVFVVGMTDGAMPSTYAESDEELAEEERLLHVGVTHASARASPHLGFVELAEVGQTTRAPSWTVLPRRPGSGATVMRGRHSSESGQQAEHDDTHQGPKRSRRRHHGALTARGR